MVAAVPAQQNVNMTSIAAYKGQNGQVSSIPLLLEGFGLEDSSVCKLFHNLSLTDFSLFYRWVRLRMNMMPFTTILLEPLGESLPLGIYVSWSMHYFFDINPYVWFACHWLVWFLLDLIQFKGIQVRNEIFKKY